MKYKKICKRLIAFILCTTISIQSFFSAEIPAYAGQATPSAMDSLEGLIEDDYENSEIDLYDETGTKLVSLSPESIALLTYGNLDDELNPFIENDLEVDGISLYSASLGLLGFFCICIIGYGVFAVSQKIITDTINYFKTYAFPSHGSSFVTTDFEFINSSGQVESYEITQSMMESIGLKLSSIENGTFWEPVLGLSDEDKLCIAYVMYKQGFLTNLKRENINITKPVSEIVEKYPYYIMAGTTKEMWQVCFDKKPIGAFCGISTSKYPMYDYYGNQIYVKSGNTIFYSGYKIKYDNGTTKLLLDICNTCLIPYKLNETAGCFDTTNSIIEYVPETYSSSDETLLYTGPGSISDDAEKQFPFHFYKALSVSDTASDKLLRVISATADYTQSTSRYDFNIVNFPHVINIEDYYNSLPDLLELNNNSFTLDSSLNLDVTTSYLNPTGVRTWDGADVRPTEVPTESVKPSESVQPSEGGGDSGTVTVTLTSILTKLSGLFDWVQNNLSPLAFATAVVSALGLTALFQTITTPLTSVLSHVSSIAGKVADIADWDINAWIGALAAPLAHLLDIDDMVSDIANWDIDALINAVPKFLSIDKTLSEIAKWNFADWPMAMSQTLRDVITSPMTALQTATDVIAKALDNVASWDVKTALKALEDAVTGALSGALTVAGIASLIEILTSVKDLIAEAIKPDAIDDTMDSNTDPSFFDLAKLLYILLAIVILLIILFLNCLRFIILIFSIPASTAFLNENIIMGIEFIKNLQVEKFNLSLYDLIVSVVYLLLFLAIIKAIRNKIDRIHF